ncbi:hypothetical protein BDP55DRAFT_633556 [Colletotrichum godetiae]|uniref:Uncharacterized protein n=1 Tax=Colletotrichum godetiae TaxID=1209918 RepID=A0AAJ0AHF2_9PEZI|nr:uncharacterized protein BDP55DRAFT_633556 [Colletotrichum godetiae]KAK1673947.1 hypothetical protein BDP55DRAFT_633556 [Colletotrichum godetiae]
MPAYRADGEAIGNVTRKPAFSFDRAIVHCNSLATVHRSWSPSSSPLAGMLLEDVDKSTPRLNSFHCAKSHPSKPATRGPTGSLLAALLSTIHIRPTGILLLSDQGGRLGDWSAMVLLSPVSCLRLRRVLAPPPHFLEKGRGEQQHNPGFPLSGRATRDTRKKKAEPGQGHWAREFLERQESRILSNLGCKALFPTRLQPPVTATENVRSLFGSALPLAIARRSWEF